MNYFWNFLILLFAFNQNVYCLTKFSKFSRFMYMDGKKCPGVNTLFETTTIKSLVECIGECSSNDNCFGIAYKDSTRECSCCDDYVKSNGTMDIFENAIFFTRHDCPDNTGTIIPRSNFRLRIFDDKDNQSNAQTVCQQELNGKLVKLDKEWKIHTVSNILINCPVTAANTFYWVDGAKLPSLPGFRFADGSYMPMDQPTFWTEGQPDSLIRNRCVALHNDPTKNSGYRFNDKLCNLSFRFICEY